MTSPRDKAFHTTSDNANYDGFTKIEYMALTAMQGILANPEHAKFNPVDVAKHSIACAISLLGLLNEKYP